MATTAKTEVIAEADAHLSNAGLVTYTELIQLLTEAAKLGLTFDIGSAYISRGYIDQQDALVARITAAKKAMKS